MQIKSSDLKLANSQLSSLISGSSNLKSDNSAYHSGDTSKLTLQEIQDMPRIASSKGYKIHPILAEILVYKPVFEVIAGLDGDNSSISLADISKSSEATDSVVSKIHEVLPGTLAYKTDEEQGVVSNFKRSADLSEMATFELSDVASVDLKGRQYFFAVERDANLKGEARSVLFIRNSETKSFKILDLEQFGVVNTGFSGIDLQETDKEYILTILSNKFNTTAIETAVDDKGHRIENKFTFKMSGREYSFIPPKPRFIVRDALLTEESTGLPIKLLVELRQKDLAPIMISSFYYLNQIHFPKEYFFGQADESSVKSLRYLMEAGRSATRQSEMMVKRYGSSARMELEGISVVGDRAYMMNSDSNDGIPTYLYIDLNTASVDKSKKLEEKTVDVQKIGDFGELSTLLGIEKIVTFGMTSRDGYLYTLHGQPGNDKDFFVVRVKESDLRSGNMQEVYKNIKIVPVNLAGYSNRTIRPYSLFFQGNEIGVGIKDGKDRTTVLYFDAKDI